MPTVQPCEVPLNTLLRDYRDGAVHVGCYVDCYAVDVPGTVTPQAFIEAFYTSPLFKVERAMLGWFAARPANDDQVRQLSAGQLSAFSAWRVESQSASELLLADITGRTRSWLMVQPVPDTSTEQRTRLYFGSAVVQHKARDGRATGMGGLFHALLGFHRIYSRLLLGAASRRVGSS